MQLTHSVKASGFKPLNLSSEKLVSKLAFKCNLYRYRMINDGIIRLIDMFFDMGKLHAMKALDVYKRATSQGDDLERFYRTANSWAQVGLYKLNPVVEP
jgi:hypothetical protein